MTPRTLDSFHGEVLILPDARCLSAQELTHLGSYLASGKTLIVTGETGRYDDTGAERRSNPIHKLLGITEPAEEKFSASGKKFAYYPTCPGKAYYVQLRKEFNQDAASGTWEQTEFNKLRKTYIGQILDVSGFKPAVQIDASPFLSAQIASVDGRVSVFLANFKGLKSKAIAQQAPEQNVKITFSADGPRTIAILPFLGQLQKIQGTFHGGKLTMEIPAVEKGAVVWLE